MDNRHFLVEHMSVIDFINKKGYDKIVYTNPSELTWEQVIIIMDEYFDTQYDIPEFNTPDDRMIE